MALVARSKLGDSQQVDYSLVEVPSRLVGETGGVGLTARNDLRLNLLEYALASTISLLGRFRQDTESPFGIIEGGARLIYFPLPVAEALRICDEFRYSNERGYRVKAV